MCTCFVAREGGAGGEPVGCALASFLAPEAALPPPWPTAKPLRLYMSNLAVLPAHQRRGVAAALLHACEVLGAWCCLLAVLVHEVIPSRGATLCICRLAGDETRAQYQTCVWTRAGCH